MTLLKAFKKIRPFIYTVMFSCGVLTFFSATTYAVPVSNDDLFLAPSGIAEDFYDTIYLTTTGSVNLTDDDIGGSLLAARILPILNASPFAHSTEGEYTDADLQSINVINYTNFFFRLPGTDYTADLEADLLSLNFLSSGQYFLEVTAEDNNQVEFTKILHIQVEDFLAEDPPAAPKDKASVSRKIDGPDTDLVLVSDGDPNDNGAMKNAMKAVTNPVKVKTLEEAITEIEKACKEKGRKISVSLIGHGRSGSIKIGTERINGDADGVMTAKAFQKRIDKCVKEIEFWSCNTAEGAKGSQFLTDFASSVGSATGFTTTLTIAPTYFDTKATSKKDKVLIDVSAPGILLLFLTGGGMILRLRRRK